MAKSTRQRKAAPKSRTSPKCKISAKRAAAKQFRQEQPPPTNRSRRKIRADRTTAGQVCRRIEKLLCRGSLVEAEEALREYIGGLERPRSRFEGYAYLRDVPLALSEMDPMCREILDEAGYWTVGHIDQASNEELCGIEGINKKRLKRIRDGVEEIAGQFVEWRISQEDLEIAAED